MKYAVLKREVVYTTSLNELDMIAMEQQIIKQALSGDQGAFQKLVNKNLPKIVALAQRMLGDHAEAQDLAQEVLIRFWKGLDQYDPEQGQLSTWLYKITANRCLDQLRKRKMDQIDEHFEQAIPPAQDSDLYKKQLGKTIESKLHSLPERQKLALILFHYQGHTMKEVALIMETTPEAVESLLGRARRTLKTTLSPIWQEFIKQEGQ